MIFIRRPVACGGVPEARTRGLHAMGWREGALSPAWSGVSPGCSDPLKARARWADFTANGAMLNAIS